MMNLRLESPGLRHEQAIEDFRQACMQAGEPLWFNLGKEDYTLPGWLSWLELRATKEGCPPNRVPSITLLCLNDRGAMVGGVNIRRELNEAMLRFAGHVGYVVNPRFRGQGIGKEQLRLALLECQKMGINPVLVTCDEDNLASRGIILSQGGVYEDSRLDEQGNPTRRYWITLPAQPSVNRKETAKSSALHLVRPSLIYDDQLLDYRKKTLALEPWVHGSSSLNTVERIADWLETLKTLENPDTCPPDLVPATQYLCVRETDNYLVGLINIRHRLNEYLENFGGHIGYSIRPGERGKGYAKAQLLLALDKCRELGIKRLLLTCNQDNRASRRTILACGGILEDTRIDPDGNHMQRYWIDMPGK